MGGIGKSLQHENTYRSVFFSEFSFVANRYQFEYR